MSDEIKRVCLVGAESSGTTSLAIALAEHYHTVWVPEYGRAYTEKRKEQGKGPWESAEFVHIAEVQNSREDEFARYAKRVMFCDTDALATCVWHERYMGHWSPECQKLADPRHFDLYIITRPDIPFVQDRIRDSAHLRDWMTQRFMEEIEKRKRPYVIIGGVDREARLKQAVAAVDNILKD